MDALWNDDFHHSAMVALTGRNEAYYTDYRGTPQEFISAVKCGYLYPGPTVQWQKKRRGTPAFGSAARRISSISFKTTIRSPIRCAACASHQFTSPGRLKAMTALLLLGPGTPMLFQGQEFAASTPFFISPITIRSWRNWSRRARRKFLAQFPSHRLRRDANRVWPIPIRRDLSALQTRFCRTRENAELTHCIEI